MPGVVHGFPFFFLLLSFLDRVSAFTFAYSPPTECDPFTVSWSGGTPPFDITLIPELDSPRKFTVSSYPENGSFSLQLPLKAGLRFVVAMSDSTGFGAGGVSDLLTVGTSITRASCSTNTPQLSFLFDLPSDLVQCQPYTINWDEAAVLPVTITGLIPLGKPIQLASATSGSNSFIWDRANVPVGTNMLFFLTDKEGRFGGSSKVLPVQGGNSPDSSCINSDSPRSTADATHGGPTAISNTASATTSPSATSTTPNATVTVSPSSGVSAAAIGGAVAGGLVACLIIGTLVIFFFRNYLPSKRSQTPYAPNPSSRGSYPLPQSDPHNRHSGNPLIDLSHNPYGSPPNWTTFSSSNPLAANDYIAEPFTASSSMHGGYSQGVAAQSQTALLSPAVPIGSSERPTHSVKSSVDYPPNRPARFIVHTDAEDEEIELPPQYRERSGP